MFFEFLYNPFSDKVPIKKKSFQLENLKQIKEKLVNDEFS